MTCPKCNFQNLEGEFVCRQCKMALVVPQPQLKHGNRRLIIFSLIVSVIIGVGFFVLYFNPINKKGSDKTPETISETLKCRPVKYNIKVNRNIEPQQSGLPQVWKGITPGKTTIQEVENILKDQITQRQDAGGKTLLNIGKEKHGFFVPSVLIDHDGTVEEISTIEPPSGYSKSQLVTEYGEPEGVVIGYPRYAPDVIDHDTFIYSSRGLEVSVSKIVDDVEYFNYFEPMSIEKFIKTLGKKYERSISKCD